MQAEEDGSLVEPVAIQKRHWARITAWLAVLLAVMPCLVATAVGGMVTLGHRSMFIWRGGTSWITIEPEAKIAGLPIFVGPQPQTNQATWGITCSSRANDTFIRGIIVIRGVRCRFTPYPNS